MGFRSAVNIYISVCMVLSLLSRSPRTVVGSRRPIWYLDNFLGGTEVSESGVISHLYSLGVNVCTCLCEQHKTIPHAEWKCLNYFSVRMNLDTLVNLF